MSELTRIVFFGSDEIALPILETLISAPLRAHVHIEAIYSQPDRPSGRGQKVRPNAVVRWANDYSIPVFQPERLGPEDVLRLQELCCDIGLVMAYGHILKPELLAAPRLGFFNYHASLLPHYRGPAPIEAAIANNDGGAGVTLQRIVPALDEGDIVGSAVIPLDTESTRASLREKISDACIFITQDTIPHLIAGDVLAIPQTEKHVSYTRKISRADAGIDFHASAKAISARVRALAGWPGCTFPFAGMEMKIGHVEPIYDLALPADLPPGTVVARHKGELIIATGDGFLKVHSLQRPGGRLLAARDFLAGMKIPAGTLIESREMIPLSRPTPWPRPLKKTLETGNSIAVPLAR
ncbi:MAG: methionyl-tRNA formyltransferase [Planctomycetia bacterium]|nr:methionyl-tRNA formyltransferase [Planctomycetia bacterium]